MTLFTVLFSLVIRENLKYLDNKKVAQPMKRQLIE